MASVRARSDSRCLHKLAPLVFAGSRMPRASCPPKPCMRSQRAAKLPSVAEWWSHTWSNFGITSAKLGMEAAKVGRLRPRWLPGPNSMRGSPPTACFLPAAFARDPVAWRRRRRCVQSGGRSGVSPKTDPPLFEHRVSVLVLWSRCALRGASPAAARHRPHRQNIVDTLSAIETFHRLPNSFRDRTNAFVRLPRLSKGLPGPSRTFQGLQSLPQASETFEWPSKAFQGQSRHSMCLPRTFQEPSRTVQGLPNASRTSQHLPRSSKTFQGPSRAFQDLPRSPKRLPRHANCTPRISGIRFQHLPKAFQDMPILAKAFQGHPKGIPRPFKTFQDLPQNCKTFQHMFKVFSR